MKNLDFVPHAMIVVFYLPAEPTSAEGRCDFQCHDWTAWLPIRLGMRPTNPLAARASHPPTHCLLALRLCTQPLVRPTHAPLHSPSLLHADRRHGSVTQPDDKQMDGAEWPPEAIRCPLLLAACHNVAPLAAFTQCALGCDRTDCDLTCSCAPSPLPCPLPLVSRRQATCSAIRRR